MNAGTRPSDFDRLARYLDGVVARYERTSFIHSDPISIPHAFDDPADREIIGLFSALLAWGRRDTLLAKLEELCERMRFKPYAFVHDFSWTKGAEALTGFVHRTFNEDDARWLCASLREIVRRFGTIEHCCSASFDADSPHVGPAIELLSRTLFESAPGMPVRMRKHLARPSTGSACKRLNLYFRWMVRPGPVDFGLWTQFRPSQLILPLDVHSGRQARTVGLLRRRSNDWKAALELTEACRHLDPSDPVRYDFAFYGSGAAGETLHSC